MEANKSRKLKIAILAGAITLAIIEVISLVFVEFLLPAGLDRFFRADFEVMKDKVLNEITLKRQDMFDPVLGWDIPPHQKGGSAATGCLGKSWNYSIDGKGSREIPVSHDKRMISLYGDSFTFGAEVNNDETWQFHLSNLTGTHVENYGVWGHGPDQALLKLKRNLEQGMGTPIVILGVYSEDIRRVVGAYRGFLTQQFSPLEFKPVLVMDDDEYRWDTTHLMDVYGRESFLHSFDVSKKRDYWYVLNQRKPVKVFPYTWNLGQLAKFIVFDYLLSSRNMWENFQAQGIFLEIVRQFRELSRQYDFLPILVFMPEAGELEGYDIGNQSYYAAFLKKMNDDGYLDDLFVVDVYKENFEPKKFMYWDESDICHPSEYGNKIIARAVMNQVGDQITARIR